MCRKERRVSIAFSAIGNPMINCGLRTSWAPYERKIPTTKNQIQYINPRRSRTTRTMKNKPTFSQKISTSVAMSGSLLSVLLSSVRVLLACICVRERGTKLKIGIRGQLCGTGDLGVWTFEVESRKTGLGSRRGLGGRKKGHHSSRCFSSSIMSCPLLSALLC